VQLLQLAAMASVIQVKQPLQDSQAHAILIVLAEQYAEMVFANQQKLKPVVLRIVLQMCAEMVFVDLEKAAPVLQTAEADSVVMDYAQQGKILYPVLQTVVADSVVMDYAPRVRIFTAHKIAAAATYAATQHVNLEKIIQHVH
jgi:hypothetical protein